MKNLFNELAVKIVEFNKEYDYVASKGEVANEIWVQLTPQQRLEIMNQVGEVGGSASKKLRLCLKFIEEQI